MLRRALFAAVFGAVVLSFGPLAAASNVVGQAVQSLNLSPQQLLSLRDFLGGFDRGVDIESGGANHFVLRDAVSKAYAGELMLQVSGDGVLQVDRVSGPARLDLQRAFRLPLRLDAKTRARIAEALAASQMLTAGDVSTAAETAPSPPEETVAGLDITDGAAGNVSDYRAVFCRDGSGSVRILRLALGSAPMRIAERYFPPLKSDGTQVWRDSVMEIDSTLPLGLADIQTGRPTPAPANQHVICWSRQLEAAVPPSLLAQFVLSPAPNQASAEATPTAVTSAPAQSAAPATEAATPDSGGR